MNERQLKEEFTRVYKEIPCMDCVVRPTCLSPGEDERSIIIKKSCNNFNDWLSFSFRPSVRCISSSPLDHLVSVSEIEKDVIKELFWSN